MRKTAIKLVTQNRRYQDAEQDAESNLLRKIKFGRDERILKTSLRHVFRIQSPITAS